MGNVAKYMLTTGIIALILVYSIIGIGIEKKISTEKHVLNTELAALDTKRKQLLDEKISLSSAKTLLSTQLFAEKVALQQNKKEIEILLQQGQQRLQMLNDKLSAFGTTELSASKIPAASTSVANNIASTSSYDYASSPTTTTTTYTEQPVVAAPDPTPAPAPEPTPVPTPVTAAS